MPVTPLVEAYLVSSPHTFFSRSPTRGLKRISYLEDTQTKFGTWGPEGSGTYFRKPTQWKTPRLFKNACRWYTVRYSCSYTTPWQSLACLKTSVFYAQCDPVSFGEAIFPEMKSNSTIRRSRESKKSMTTLPRPLRVWKMPFLENILTLSQASA